MTRAATLVVAALVWGAPAARADAPAAAPTPADAPRADPAPAGAPGIAQARDKLAAGDVDGALSALAAVSGPLSFDDVLARYQILGVARAYSDDAAGAEEAFKTLLILAPGAALPYTMSPKATFPFERARRALAGQPALELELEPEDVYGFDEPVRLDVARVSDPLAMVSSVRVCAHVKGADAPPSCSTTPAPALGGHITVDVPAVTRPPSLGDDEGVYLQVSLVATDAAGSEVWRGPTPERPRELPVGFATAPPWYLSPIAIGGYVGAAVVGTTVAIAALTVLRPSTSPVKAIVKSP